MAIGLLAVVLHGCEPPDRRIVRHPMDPAQDRLIELVNAYFEYNRSHRVPPRSAADIEPILRERGSPEDVLRSPRDGELLVVCWGTDISKPTELATAGPILAYEKFGRDGGRFVVFAARKVELLTDDAFRQASFPAGFEPEK